MPHHSFVSKLLHECHTVLPFQQKLDEGLEMGRIGGPAAFARGKAVRVQNVYLKNPQRYDFSRSPHVGEIKLDVNENVIALNTGELLRY